VFAVRVTAEVQRPESVAFRQMLVPRLPTDQASELFLDQSLFIPPMHELVGLVGKEEFSKVSASQWERGRGNDPSRNSVSEGKVFSLIESWQLSFPLFR